MSNNLIFIIGITLIFIGLILYGVSSYMVRYYDKKINKHKFEIIRPKPKGKKIWYLIMNIRGCAIVKCANY